MKPIKVVDLFAGPGGLGEGFSSAKDKNGDFAFKLVVSVEKEKSAHETLTLRSFIREFHNRRPPRDYYAFLRGEITKNELFDRYPAEYNRAQNETLNKPRELGNSVDDKVVHASIREALGNDKKWILIGGPPCQAYSLVGRAKNTGTEGYIAENDNRHFLYKEYLHILNSFKPTAFVMENVKGILSSKVKGKFIFSQILNDLREAGYSIYSFSTEPHSIDLINGPVYKTNSDFVIKAENYCIPQNRHRVILLGIKKEIRIDPSLILLKGVEKIAVKQVIADLPKLRSGVSKEDDSLERWRDIIRSCHLKNFKKRKPLTWPKAKSRGASFVKSRISSNRLPVMLRKFICDKKVKGYINHESRSHMQDDLARYYFASTFARANAKNPRLKDFPRWLQPKHANRDSGKFVDRFKVQMDKQPANTVTSHISKDGHYFIHYDPLQCRSLTVREAARLQTFPDNYLFCGNRTQQYVQVGNAVPPFLAKQIAGIILKILD